MFPAEVFPVKGEKLEPQGTQGCTGVHRETLAERLWSLRLQPHLHYFQALRDFFQPLEWFQISKRCEL